ncbi:MAG TPA: hypothetical protein VFT78_00205 [Hanamia sp.]|jgi:hypothetical protein|nr:hypothetical protein [Hanamia sp.]
MNKKITMLLAFMLIATTGIFAQGMQRMSVPDRVKMTMDKITPALNLSADQQASTDSVFTDYYSSMMKMFQDARESGERPDRSQFQKMMDDRDAKLKNIFTADQFTKWKNEVEPSLRPQRQRQN